MTRWRRFTGGESMTREIPILDSCDVLVCGGGFGGISAALAAARLDSLSPLAVLGRGYSVSQKSDYTLVSSVDDLRWGDELLTTVADGVITSVVQQVERR